MYHRPEKLPEFVLQFLAGTLPESAPPRPIDMEKWARERLKSGIPLHEVSPPTTGTKEGPRHLGVVPEDKPISDESTEQLDVQGDETSHPIVPEAEIPPSKSRADAVPDEAVAQGETPQNETPTNAALDTTPDVPDQLEPLSDTSPHEEVPQSDSPQERESLLPDVASRHVAASFSGSVALQSEEIPTEAHPEMKCDEPHASEEKLEDTNEPKPRESRLKQIAREVRASHSAGQEKAEEEAAQEDIDVLRRMKSNPSTTLFHLDGDDDADGDNGLLAAIVVEHAEIEIVE